MASLVPAGSNKLRWAKYSSPYRARLLEGAKVLRTFLEDHGESWSLVLSGNSASVDEILDAFVRHMHGSKLSSALRLAKHAVLFVQIARPRLKRSLKASWNSLKCWEEDKPSQFRPPLPLALLAAMLCQARLRAEQAESNQMKLLWLRFSTLLGAGFYGLLRPGELLSLCPEDVVLPNSMSLGAPFCVVRISRTKNARQMGIQQFAEIHHPDTVNWLSWLVQVSKVGKPLWPSNPARFRAMFHSVCVDLRIAELKLTPASLRAGGATWMLDERNEVSRIRFQGRWTNLRSLEHYLQVARAQQITLSLHMTVIEKIKRLLMTASFMLSLPAFLSARVPHEHLLQSAPLVIADSRRVVTDVRRWGQPRQTIPEDCDHWGCAQGSAIHRCQCRGHQKSSTIIQS